ncbi:glycerol-3-phosphate acyltransferase 1, mitochondrial-like [Corticium candelabrum]|uniref:glycerol-3-phosphate acyltransferase 1, mitochondrial-like n=1 Tax=Corticium candelabrum TaxID=121492 RepID=UPI002E273752|nr:glycerol-3-phosphate acyltransferase 1, mitochondrial-like [Corticium candelabrum]
MDETQLSRLNAVYSRWNTRTPNTLLRDELKSSNDSSSRTAWQKRFDETKRLHRPQTRARRRTKTKKTNVAQVLPVTFTIKLPLVTTHSTVQKPFSGRCCEACTPFSRNQLFDSHIQAAPVRDVLQLPNVMRPNVWRRLFPHLTFCLSRDVPWTHNLVEQEVLKSDRIGHVIRQAVDSEGKASSEIEMKNKLQLQQQKAMELLATMASSISGFVVRLTGIVLFKLFGSATDGIRVHQGQMEMVERAAKQGVPIIYLPMHKSHLDYHMLTFTAFCHNLKTPHVAAGDNLNTWGLSLLLRCLGGFFIRRKLEDANGHRDPIYNTILQEYIQCLLKQGEHIEFFLEGCRSRSGKVLRPKCGLLSMVVDAVADDIIPDVFIVPVSCGYDKIAECYGDELLGRGKKQESLIGGVRSVWRLVTGDYGTIQVNMAQPFSLQEFLETHPGFESDKSVRREVVSKLGRHVLYAADRSSCVMSTAMLAFLMLNKYRDGVSYGKLVNGFSRLQQEITSRQRDVGFGVSAFIAMNKAHHLLKPYLIEETSSDDKNETIVKPDTTLPGVFELAFYSNQVLSVFLTEAVVATAICGLCGAWLTTEASCGISESTTLSQDEMLARSEEICCLFDCEFIFAPPCVTIRSTLYEGLEALIGGGMMTYTTTQDTRQVAYWDDDEEGEYTRTTDRTLKLHALSDQLQKLSFFHSLMAPFVESYWTTACCLRKLTEQPMTEKEFLSEVQDTIKQRVEEDLCSYAESCSLSPLSNALTHFTQEGVMERSEVSTDYLLLNEQYTLNNCRKLNDLIDSIGRFRRM